MPVTIVATAGSETANSFLTLAAAEAYFAERLDAAAWSNQGTEVKKQALVTASGFLDRQAWLGDVASEAQRLQWPREGTVDRSGRELAGDAIPRAVEEATCELALALLVAVAETDAAASAARAAKTAAGTTGVVKEITDGDTTVKFAGAPSAPVVPQTAGIGAQRATWPRAAVQAVAHLLAAAPGTLRVVRGS